MLTTRSTTKELIDLGPEFYTAQEYNDCLKILFKINKLLGFFNFTVKTLSTFPADASVVDIGCGGGLFLLNLSKHYPKMQLLGVDVSRDAINLAQNELKLWKQKKSNLNVSFELQDIAELSLERDSVDIIIATLVCHHIEDEALIEFLQNSINAVKQAVIINDLHRHPLAYWFYKKFSLFIFRNRLITHDGLISVQRGFTRVELERLLERANIHNYRIKWGFPFRWSIVLWKK